MFRGHLTDNPLLAANPDLSNPTRSRFERPLDTIRGFEAAINGAYRRQSMVRAGKQLVTPYQRRRI